ARCTERAAASAAATASAAAACAERTRRLSSAAGTALAFSRRRAGFSLLATTASAACAAASAWRRRSSGNRLHAEIPTRRLDTWLVAVGERRSRDLAHLMSRGIGDLQLHIADLSLEEPRDHSGLRPVSGAGRCELHE